MAAPATPAARRAGGPRSASRAAASPASQRSQARRSAAAAAAARRGHSSRSTAIPSRSRRISGPAKRRRVVTRSKRRLSLATLPAHVVALADARFVDRLLRGRGWIAIVGVLLIGLVALQVSMLKLNAGIGAAVERSSTLERQNASLEATNARLSSADRIRGKARKLGLVPPRIDRNRYVYARAGNAAAAAAAIAGGAFVAQQGPADGEDPAAGTTGEEGEEGAYSPEEIDAMLSDGDPSNDAQAMLNDGDPSNDADAMLNDGDPSNDDQALAGSDGGADDGYDDGTG
jgi:hypothetical protein